jgi:poly-gamma-glutamate synthesis protein (capsule biosynthesis protein)
MEKRMGAPFPKGYILRSFYDFFRPSGNRPAPLNLASPPLPANPGKEERLFRLIFGGDIMTPRYRAVPLVSPALKRTLAEADLFIANCEGPLVGKKRPSMLFPRTYFDLEEGFLRAFLEEMGLPPSKCVLSVANNHMGDRGWEGFRATVRCLHEMEITFAGDCPEGRSPLKAMEKNGLRLGFLAWTHWQNRRVFQDSSGVLRLRDVLDKDWRSHTIRQGIDCLVGMPHWGIEFRHFPRPEERGVAESLIKNGVKILAGHHPHVLQPLEWIGGRPCFYSLGNMSGPPFPFLPWPLRLGAFFEVCLFGGGAKRGEIAGFAVHPFLREKSGGGERLFSWQEARPPLREKVQARLQLLFPSPKAGVLH